MKIKYLYIALFLSFSGLICSPSLLHAQELNCDDEEDDDDNDDEGDDFDIPVVHAFDPNDITGPIGYDSLRWVSHKDVMGYTVRFENDPNFATAPAQLVTITHPIDDEMDLFSFRLGEFGFGDFIFSVPPNRTFYNQRLDVIDSLGVYVDVTFGLDVPNRSAFWIFQSIDPATGLAGTVPANVGFLPVNDTAINRFNNFATQKGEGFVTFTIQPNSQVQTGDTADADASIVFDINAPIPTNIWTNIIDAKGPTSQLDPVPGVVDSTFVLSCTAVDDTGGVGVASYSIYVSEDGNPFYRIAADVHIDSSFVFQGKSGTNYCLYSLAKDFVGNEEKAKSQADQCVFRQVKGDLLLAAPNGGELLCPEDTLQISWQHDIIPEVDILYSPDSGMNFFPIAFNIPSDDGTYQWPLPDSLSPATTYLIRIENSATNSLIDTSNATFTILNSPAKPGIAASGPLAFCEMNQVTLSGQAGFSKYFWSTGDTSLTIQVDSADTFSLQVEDANGCISPISDPVQTTVNPLPAQPAITANGSLTFCQGDSVGLQAPMGFANYNWSNMAASQSIFAKNAGSYTLSVIDANGCESPASAAVLVMVDTLPAAPVILPMGPTTVCDGQTVGLIANTGTISYPVYLWSTGDTLSMNRLQLVQSALVSAAVIDGNGCQSMLSQPQQVIVNPLPPRPLLQIAAGGNPNFCQGDSIALQITTGTYPTYAWSTGDTTASISVKQTGLFYVSVIDTNGCESSLSDTLSTMVFALPPQPTVLANGPTVFCDGDSVQLRAPSGFAMYIWSNGGTDSLNTIRMTDTLDVRVVDANGCESPLSSTIQITVNALPIQPVITASGPTTFCEGDSVQLSVQGMYPDYRWSDGVTGDSARWIFATDTLDVTVVNQNGCESPVSTQTIVTVNPNPLEPGIVPLGPTTFCEGDSVRLQAPAGLATYNWSNGAGGSTITVFVTDTLSLSVVDANGCESPLSAPLLIQQNALPPQQMILANGPLIFCDGDSVQLQAPAGFAAYRWSDGDTNSIRTVSMSGLYQVTVRDTNGCESPFSDPVSVQVLAIPAQPMIIQLSADSLTSSVLGTSYQWFLDGNILPDTTQTIFINQDGSYTVIVFNGPCASAESDSLSTPLLELLPAESIEIFPNPNDGMFVIRGQFRQASLLEFTFYNQLGQEIYRKELFAPQGILNEVIRIDKLADGIYIAQLRLNNRFTFKKVEVRR